MTLAPSPWRTSAASMREEMPSTVSLHASMSTEGMLASKTQMPVRAKKAAAAAGSSTRQLRSP
eukprot:887117-Prymnesium_polylepis.1